MNQGKKVYVVPEIEKREQLKEVSGQLTVSGVTK
jgi:hypothetical protein